MCNILHTYIAINDIYIYIGYPWYIYTLNITVSILISLLCIYDVPIMFLINVIVFNIYTLLPTYNKYLPVYYLTLPGRACSAVYDSLLPFIFIIHRSFSSFTLHSVSSMS